MPKPTKTTPVFKVIDTTGGIRRGVLTTPAGKVLTPTFMPDGTRGAVKGLTPQQVADAGIQVVLANTYHLHLSPGEKVVKSLGGLHQFAQRSEPILTDSGGFQVFSLAHRRKISEDGVTFHDPATGNKVLLTPEKSIQIQFDLGADMMVAFDDVTALDEKGRGRTLEAFERTHRWLERSVAEFQRLSRCMLPGQRPLLFGVVQGGLDKDLRRRSLELVQASGVNGIAIGGLSVGESRRELYKMLRFLAPLYDPQRPHFLLGVGEPMDMRVGIANGIDMFDCVIPTRNARHGSAWITGDTRIQLTNSKFTRDKKMIDPGCDCYTCSHGFSRGFLRHQFKVNEPLAGSLVSIHNLRYLERLCESYRNG